MYKLQEINFPPDCRIIKHDFYTYDPQKDFKEGLSIKYLGEDILQCSFPKENLIIDLGWYGDLLANEGEFKIQIIQSENWQIPFNVIHSKSVNEIRDLLNKILQYYTQSKEEEE